MDLGTGSQDRRAYGSREPDPHCGDSEAAPPEEDMKFRHGPHRMTEITCVQCGKKFQGHKMGSLNRFCGNDCANLFHAPTYYFHRRKDNTQVAITATTWDNAVKKLLKVYPGTTRLSFIRDFKIDHRAKY